MIGHSTGVRGMGLPLLRVKAGGVVRLTMVSDVRVVLHTHWLNGCSVLCCGDGDHCCACDVSSSRPLAYFVSSVDVVPVSQPVLVECSLTSLTQLEGCIEGSWYGWRVEASRAARKRGLVFRLLEKTELWPVGLGEVWRVLGAIGALYSLPGAGRDETPEEWSRRTLGARERRVQQALSKG